MDRISDISDRFRPDIEWVLYPDQSKWVARDPLSSVFYYFNQFEYTVATLLDGRHTFDQVLNTLNQRFPHRSVNQQWLIAFVAKLKNASLTLPAGNGACNLRLPGRATPSVGFVRQWALNPLAVRLPILDPTRFLSRMRLPAQILFHPLVATIGLAMSVIGGFLVLNRLLREPELLISNIAEFGVGWWLTIFAVFLLVKALHEFGHALACVRWNAHCREVGIYLLFFTPCLYCDTTDSWKLQSKWHRAAIAAAGMYVEFLIAGLAAWVWLSTSDGAERTVAASVMLMCSLGTLAFNGNPCFKYDGYFILSDVWGVPNLSQQSSAAWWQLFLAMLGGRATWPQEFDTNRGLLAAYSIVSATYRLIVLVLLLWLAWTMLVPKGLGFVAILIVATTVFSLLGRLRRFSSRLISEFFAPQPIKITNFAVLSIALLGGLYGVTSIPISNFVRARGVLDFQDKVALFATHNASLAYAVQASSAVHKNQLVFELDCPEKQLEEIQLANEISQISRQIELLKKSSVQDPSAAYEIPTLSAILKELESKLGVLRPELESLRFIAPAEGFFLPSDELAQPPLTRPSQIRLLKHLSHESNRGGAVERGTLLGWFTTKKELSFHTLVSESDIQWLRIGMQAECMLDGQTSPTLTGHISHISSEPVDEITLDNFGDGWVAVERDKNGKLKPILPHYQVSVDVDSDLPLAIKGANATVQFKIASRTIAERLNRYLRMTFRPVY